MLGGLASLISLLTILLCIMKWKKVIYCKASKTLSYRKSMWVIVHSCRIINTALCLTQDILLAEMMISVLIWNFSIAEQSSSVSCPLKFIQFNLEDTIKHKLLFLAPPW